MKPIHGLKAVSAVYIFRVEGIEAGARDAELSVRAASRQAPYRIIRDRGVRRNGFRQEGRAQWENSISPRSAAGSRTHPRRPASRQ
jgi:hypothetical protein